MSVMEKRLQLLLDAHRWELVSREAERTQRSAASVIREAIDVHLAGQDESELRSAAALRLLARLDSRDREGEVASADVGRALDEDLQAYLDKKLRA